MTSKFINTRIGKRTLKLSNLDKILYPDAGITKAEIIQYYLSIEKLILPLVKDRPITMIRYPDGIDNARFYSKNLPKWTPDWIQRTSLGGEDDNSYLVFNDMASIIWSVNLASLELHSTQTKVENLDSPDHFIFDLDPPEVLDFEEVKQLALKLKPFLENYGYTPFIKTSGSRGLHIYVPIHPVYTNEISYNSVKLLAGEFVNANAETTLILSKEKRKGRVLLDIYRNHKSQTCAIPYSTRGKPGCPISCPIYWHDLSTLSASTDIHIRNVAEYIAKGNPWSKFYESKAYHRDDKSNTSTRNVSPLLEYDKKRSFDKTIEPEGKISSKNTGKYRFVIQLHNASNLHYDLRLEYQGVLVSWAVPKGMPLMKAEKRLAIQTEAHPIEYLDFEGKIPDSEYGDGEMWLFDTGNYEIVKWSDKSIDFILNGKFFKGAYQINKMKVNQWLLTTKEEGKPLLTYGYKPQLAGMGTYVPQAKEYNFEIKWDGIRAFIYKMAADVKIFSRTGNDITNKFPAIAKEILDSEPEYAIFDSEIVVLDENGAPLFGKVVGRMHLKGKISISKAAKSTPATCYLFDCLYLDGRPTVNEPLEKRRNWTKIQFNAGKNVRYSETFDDGKTLFEAAKTHGLEGIMAKEKGSKYYLGQRHSSWIKVKVRTELEVYIIGYTLGEGERSGTFGALHSAEILDDGAWFYRGKIGTGYDQNKIKLIQSKLDELQQIHKPTYVERYEEKESVWVEPQLKALVNYASITPDGILREPVFMELI